MLSFSLFFIAPKDVCGPHHDVEDASVALPRGDEAELAGLFGSRVLKKEVDGLRDEALILVVDRKPKRAFFLLPDLKVRFDLAEVLDQHV